MSDLEPKRKLEHDETALDSSKGRAYMLSKLKQRVFALPPKTPEEIAQRNADLQARNGTSIEWAELQPNLSIAQNISQYMMAHGLSSIL